MDFILRFGRIHVDLDVLLIRVAGFLITDDVLLPEVLVTLLNLLQFAILLELLVGEDTIN